MFEQNKLKAILREWIAFVGFAVLWFCFYHLSFVQHFSVDDYSHKFGISNDIVQALLHEGRFVSALVYKVFCDTFNVVPVNSQPMVFFMVFILFTACASIVYLTYISVLDERKDQNVSLSQKVIIFAATALIFFNPFFIDWYQFTDVVLNFSVGLLLVVGASVLFFSQKKLELKKTILATVLLILAIGSYQVLGVYFFLIGLPLLFIRCQQEGVLFSRSSIRKFLLGCALYAIAVISNLCVMMLVGNSSRGATDSLTDKIINIITTQKHLWQNTYGLTYDYLLLVGTLVIAGVVLFLLLRRKQKMQPLFAVLICFFTTYIVLFVPALKESWISPRTITAFMALPSVLLFCSLGLLNSAEVITQKKGSLQTLIAASLILVVFFAINTQKPFYGTIHTNQQDKQEVQAIMKVVKSYELKTGNKVTKLSIAGDAYPLWVYPDVISTHDLNVRALRVTWARAPIFRLYSGRIFEVQDMPQDIYNAHFQDKNWDVFSNEQIFMEGDTAYICVY